MMPNDYPPMDKDKLDAMLAGKAGLGPHCMWGCKITKRMSAAAGGVIDRNWHWLAWECPMCKRRSIVYELFSYRTEPHVIAREIHAGWPPFVNPYYWWREQQPA